MKKSPFFSVSAGALLLGLLIYFGACVKEQNTSDLTSANIEAQITATSEPSIIPIVEGVAIDRGCSPCTGSFSVATTHPENTPFTAELQSKLCENDSWVTEQIISTTVPFVNNSFQVGHEKYYRIVLTNNGTKTRNFFSHIFNPPGMGSIGAFPGDIFPSQSVTVAYSGKGNCGCEWVYDCSGTQD